MKKRYVPETDSWTCSGEPCEEPKSVPLGSDGGGTCGFGRGWPIHSEAAGCHPDQIPEHIEHDRLHGVPTEYDSTGRPILRDRAHRKRYLKAHGLRDNDGCYSD